MNPIDFLKYRKFRRNNRHFEKKKMSFIDIFTLQIDSECTLQIWFT